MSPKAFVSGRFDWLNREIRRQWPFLVIIFILFPLALLHGKFTYAPSDDMYIFLVYARNFLSHHGLTFNGTVVQGYTSTLWVVLLCLLGLTHIDLPSLAITLSILSGLLVLLATYALSKRLQIESSRALLPVILLAATGDFAYYMTVGLEQALFTAMITGGVVLIFSKEAGHLLHSLYFPAYLALMVLVRPEGVLISGLFLFILWISSKSVFSILRCGATLAAMLAPVFIAGRIFYGYWLPNTYYIKSNAGLANLPQGLRYLFIQSWSFLPLLVALIFVLVVCLVKREFTLLKKMWPLGLILFVWVAYVVVEGGDNLIGARLLLPILPLVYSAFIKMLEGIKIRNFAAFASAGLIAGGCILGYHSNPVVQKQAQNYRQWFIPRKTIGLYLHDHFPADTLIAVDPAGIIPFYSQLPTIDMLGLNDPTIAHHGQRDYSLTYAHQVGDGAYVLARKPDIILFGPSGLDQAPGDYISDREIWASPAFHQDYELVSWQGSGYAYLKK